MIKKITLFFSVIFMLASTLVRAQYCGGSGTSVCVPPTSLPAVGFYPSYDSLPCAQLSSPFDQTIYFLAPTTVTQQGNTYPLNYIQVDSIENLPCGLCWRMGNSQNRVNGGATACVRITGTTNDAIGQFKLRVIVSANVQIAPLIPLTVNNQNAESLGVKYWIKVGTPSFCPTVDTTAIGNTKSIIVTTSAPTISAPAAFCSGQSATITANGSYDNYVWSNGALTQSINVTQGGTYTVTVYDNCASASASVNVTMNNTSVNIQANGPTTFCQGGSVTLNAGTGYSSYIWSNGATSSSINVTTADTYSVTVTQNGCSATDSELVTIVANNLNPTITPSTVDFCPGGFANFDAGLGYDSYAWSSGETDQVLTVNSGGTYTVTVTLGTCSGTATATANVSSIPLLVNAQPSGPVLGCIGDVITLDAGSNYDSYLWSNNEQSQTIEVTGSGSFSVVAVKNGCFGYDTVQVILNPVPSPEIIPSGGIPLCPGESVTLNAGVGYDTYTWSNGATTPTTSVSSSSSYNVTVTQNGCSGNSTNPAIVTVNPNPIASVSIINNSPEFTLKASPSGMTTYQWQYAQAQDTTTGLFLPFNINKDTLTVDCATQGGYWRVAVVDANLCKDTSYYTTVPICTGLEDVINLTSITLSPNPANHLLTVQYQLNKISDLQLNIIDLTGRQILKVATGQFGQGIHKQTVDIAALPSGVYLLNFNNENGSFNLRFIKE